MDKNVVTDKHQGYWYTLKVIDFKLSNEQTYHYRYVTRTDRCNKGGVEVTLLLKKQDKLYLMLTKNSRYLIDSYCIEFPVES